MARQDHFKRGALREGRAGQRALLADELEDMKTLQLPLGQIMLFQQHGTPADHGHIMTILKNFRKFVNPVRLSLRNWKSLTGKSNGVKVTLGFLNLSNLKGG